MTQPVLFERDGPVARVTLNRPEAANSIDLPLARALLQAALDCDADASIRCVVLTGAGRFFCGGGDVASFADSQDRLPALLKELTASMNMAVSRFARMGKPLVTMINGPAAGAGFSLAMLGDLVIAGRSAHFTAAYTAIGLTPDCGLTWLLPRLVGVRRAQDMVLTNRRVPAEEALDIGLVTRVVEDADLAAETAALAAKVAGSATEALGRARNLLLNAQTTTLEAHLEAEAHSIAWASGAPQGREGIAAFLAKRKPNFKT